MVELRVCVDYLQMDQSRNQVCYMHPLLRRQIGTKESIGSCPSNIEVIGGYLSQ